MVVVLGVLFYIGKNRDAKTQEYYESIYSEQMAEQLAEEQAIKDITANGSVYQKLSKGLNVSILFVGDSIAAGTGAGSRDNSFANRLSNKLMETYKSKIKINNVSMGGNTSYAGYTRTMMLDDGVQYDLAIICFGQNDKVQNFSLYYETIIRAISNKYPKCSIISVLESSQMEYTAKMKTIQQLCEHYSIPVADTIAPFQANYDSLVKDAVHPNDEGHRVYAETIEAIVKEQVNKNTPVKSYNISPVNAETENFKNFRYIGKSEFTMEENSFKISTTASGIFGIDYKYVSGQNTAEIFVDGKLFATPTADYKYDSSQRKILIVDDNCTVNKTIEIKFKTTEQADGFEGVAFSWK